VLVRDVIRRDGGAVLADVKLRFVHATMAKVGQERMRSYI
jgi:hypothetical protein